MVKIRGLKHSLGVLLHAFNGVKNSHGSIRGPVSWTYYFVCDVTVRVFGMGLTPFDTIVI